MEKYSIHRRDKNYKVVTVQEQHRNEQYKYYYKKS